MRLDKPNHQAAQGQGQNDGIAQQQAAVGPGQNDPPQQLDAPSPSAPKHQTLPEQVASRILSVCDDPSYEIRCIDLAQEAQTLGGPADSITAGSRFDIRRIGENFEVREQGASDVLVFHPAGVRVERWGMKAQAKPPITAPEVAKVKA